MALFRSPGADWRGPDGKRGAGSSGTRRSPSPASPGPGVPRVRETAEIVARSPDKTNVITRWGGQEGGGKAGKFQFGVGVGPGVPMERKVLELGLVYFCPFGKAG